MIALGQDGSGLLPFERQRPLDLGLDQRDASAKVSGEV